MRDLAQLWDPKIPAHANAAYMARAQALEKHLEAALMSSLENSRPTHPQSVKASNTKAAPSKPDPTILKDE